jgi:WD40 repeat protein
MPLYEYRIPRCSLSEARISTPQYWVIDAIDECSKYQELFTLIKGIQLSFPLRIFITSRKIPELQRIHRSLEASVSITCIEVSAEDSTSDIGCYIQERVKNLANDLVGGKKDIAETLLRRSNTCFLWVRLVLDELEKVYTTESITQILQSIPEGMVPYYERTVRAMAENTLEKHVARAVLVWVVASSRNLFIPELSNALKSDINTVLPSAKSAVEGLCGQLIFVDHQSGMVSLVHTTVREFLLSESAREFYIFKPRAHERIALTCLKLLSSGEMKPPRSQRMLSQARKNLEPSPLMNYAITQFSEHVYSASAETDEILLALDLFLKTNILSWIERVAQMGDLYPLIRVSKNLKGYLDRRAKYISPLSNQVQIVDNWSTDLSRIATKFGSALLQDPSSIHFLIPPFCPLSSAIYRQFAKRPGPSGLSVVGHRENAWDDCVASVNFGEDSIAAAVSCGENLIAVGMESGDINFFNRKSCQKEGMIHQKHPIDLIHFTDRSIAACTTRSVVLMDRMGNTIWQIRLRFRCILLTSSANAIVAVSQHGHVLKWDISTGTLLGDQAFAYTSPDDDGDKEPSVKAPDVASLSADMETLALAYRWGTVCIFEVESGEVIAWPRDECNRLAPVLLFNPNPNLSLLLIIYTDHGLALYETDTGALVSAQETSSTAGILSASCSPDGRTLATVDKQGVLQIWDFESLSLLYHVLSPATSFRIIDFVSDGSSVVDVTDSGMRIWNPATLVRKNIEEDQSISDDALYLAATEGEYEARRVSKITALCAHPSLPIAFAGKHNGQVIAFDTKTGLQIVVLYTHPHGAFVSGLAVSQNGMVASSDVNCVIQVWNLKQALSPTHLYTYAAAQIKGRVKQLCFSTRGDYLLVATTQADQVYSMTSGSCVGSLQFEHGERKVWRWLQVPSPAKQSEQFALMHDHKLTEFSASAFPSKIDGFEADLHYDVGNCNDETDINSAVIHPETQTLVLDVRYASGYISSSSMFLFDLSKMTLLSDLLPKYCKHLIGVSERTRSLVFLHQNSWLCSINLANIVPGRYTQHFYVPDEYMSVRHEVLPVRTSDDSVVFCLHGELAVVMNGLNMKEMKPFE